MSRTGAILMIFALAAPGETRARLPAGGACGVFQALKMRLTGFGPPARTALEEAVDARNAALGKLNRPSSRGLTNRIRGWLDLPGKQDRLLAAYVAAEERVLTSGGLGHLVGDKFKYRYQALGLLDQKKYGRTEASEWILEQLRRVDSRTANRLFAITDPFRDHINNYRKPRRLSPGEMMEYWANLHQTALENSDESLHGIIHLARQKKLTRVASPYDQRELPLRQLMGNLDDQEYPRTVAKYAAQARKHPRSALMRKMDQSQPGSEFEKFLYLAEAAGSKRDLKTITPGEKYFLQLWDDYFEYAHAQRPQNKAIEFPSAFNSKRDRKTQRMATADDVARGEWRDPRGRWWTKVAEFDLAASQSPAKSFAAAGYVGERTVHWPTNPEMRRYQRAAVTRYYKPGDAYAREILEGIVHPPDGKPFFYKYRRVGDSWVPQAVDSCIKCHNKRGELSIIPIQYQGRARGRSPLSNIGDDVWK